jgi:hypothetical protein
LANFNPFFARLVQAALTGGFANAALALERKNGVLKPDSKIFTVAMVFDRDSKICFHHVV